jgi:hypothetical protein
MPTVTTIRRFRGLSATAGPDRVGRRVVAAQQGDSRSPAFVRIRCEVSARCRSLAHRPAGVEESGGTLTVTGLLPWAGFAVLCGYAAFALGLAIVQLRRRDV